MSDLDRLQDAITEWSNRVHNSPGLPSTMAKFSEEYAELVIAVKSNNTDSVRDEVADVLINLLAVCRHFNISLYEAITEKHAVNLAKTFVLQDDGTYKTVRTA